jgi:probable F420-dependent oxidoreductase
MGAAALAEAAPDRFILGIGAGSSVTVERWNGLKYDKPLKKVAEVTQALRLALDGEQMNFQGETVNVSGFRLGRPPGCRVPIYIAALREKMIRQAVRLSDGVIINWLSPADVKQVVVVVKDEAAKVGKDGDSFPVVCRINLAVTDDVKTARAMFRRAVTAYLNVPVYRAFHEWLGRGEEMRAMNELWDSGDRKGALEAVPAHVVDELAGLGPAEHCYERVVEYMDAGVTVPAINFMRLETERQARAEGGMSNMRALAPR